MEKRGNSGERVEGMRYTPHPPSGREIMEAFDGLPEPVRRALSEASANFNPVEISIALKHGFPAGRMATDLRLASLEFVERSDEARGIPRRRR